MNILVLCDRYPSSLHDGLSLRVIHYVRNLRDRHSFDLVCYGPRNDATDLTGLFRRIEVFDKPVERKTYGFAKLMGSFSLRSLYPVSDQVKEHLETIIPKQEYDVIWDAGSNMLLNLPPNAAAVPLLADTVDDPTLEQWRQLRNSRTLGTLARNMKQLFMFARFNRRFIAAASANLLVSELDAAFYQRTCPGKRVEVIHNGVDTDYFRPQGHEIEKNSLVFEGSISFAPNREGVLYFVHDILPLIRKHSADVTFTVVGRNPPPEIVALAGDGITVTGFVDDVRPYLDHAAVFVCPLRSGAGIKNKILQAWSMGKAVVATTQSTGGLKCIDGENIVVRDDAAAFAAEVARLLAHPEEATRIGNNAQKTIIEHYTWKSKARQLDDLLQSIATSRGK